MAEPLVVYAVDERWKFLRSTNWELIKAKHAAQTRSMLSFA